MGDNKNSFTVNRSRVGTMAQIGETNRLLFDDRNKKEKLAVQPRYPCQREEERIGIRITIIYEY